MSVGLRYLGLPGDVVAHGPELAQGGLPMSRAPKSQEGVESLINRTSAKYRYIWAFSDLISPRMFEQSDIFKRYFLGLAIRPRVRFRAGIAPMHVALRIGFPSWT